MNKKIENYENLKFTNWFMFSNILRHDQKLCQEIVEVILDVKIREIISISGEETIDANLTGRGIRMDVYLEGDDAIYDIEMQTENAGNLKKRSRYYQGILDTDYLDKGEDYNKLKKTCIIFLCTFDLFGKGLCKYTFRNICIEDPRIELSDESEKVFVNAKGVLENASPKLRELLTYIDTGEVTGEMTEHIETRVREARRNERMRQNYMTFEWHVASEARKAKEAGREEERIGNIKMMLKKLSPSEVLDLGFSEDDIALAQKS